MTAALLQALAIGALSFLKWWFAREDVKDVARAAIHKELYELYLKADAWKLAHPVHPDPLAELGLRPDTTGAAAPDVQRKDPGPTKVQ